MNRVYPRAYGETFGDDLPDRGASGLSPRLRGNPSASPPPGSAWGSIPALTGKPSACSASASCWRVYPRAYGETLGDAALGNRDTGLSPRLRGNLLARRALQNSRRSIPALTGKPRQVRRRIGCDKVYPRAYGETSRCRSYRGGGGGLSPRLRGNRDRTAGGCLRGRSIPALTGKPRAADLTAGAAGVYPRAYGETRRRRPRRPTEAGLSPRLRGNQKYARQRAGSKRSIPALTGKPAGSSRRRANRRVYPRAYGETTSVAAALRAAKGLSPRLRGNRRLTR